eukprot:m.119367 g.119367  ORF g.119367 m.119367 type:complete len:457 (+) comp9355_c0_seq1:36-1406(+)
MDEKRENVETLRTIMDVLGDTIQVDEFVEKARVPIVKGKHRELGVEMDINVNNPLGVRNTLLLSRYCSIDDRVQKLGFLVKYWAKQCGVNSSPDGTLSSYAWINLAIHFLQQCDPPVIPYLQQIGDVHKVMVGTHNTYFCDNEKDLKHGWSRYKENKASLAELYFNFFVYWSHFDFRFNVPHIIHFPGVVSKDSLIGKFNTTVAVKDPFDDQHNLTATVTTIGWKFIRHCILHRIRVLESFQGVNAITSQYLNTRATLTNNVDTPPPQCIRCHGIGHAVFQCGTPRFRRGNQSRDRHRDRNRGHYDNSVRSSDTSYQRTPRERKTTREQKTTHEQRNMHEQPTIKSSTSEPTYTPFYQKDISQFVDKSKMQEFLLEHDSNQQHQPHLQQPQQQPPPQDKEAEALVSLLESFFPNDAKRLAKALLSELKPGQTEDDLIVDLDNTITRAEILLDSMHN